MGRSGRKNKPLNRRKFLIRAGLGIGGFLAATAVYGVGVEPEMLQAHEVKVKIKGLPDSFEGYRVGLISDTHYPDKISQAFIDRAQKELCAMKPDIVCFVGDFIDGNSRHYEKSVSIKGVFDILDAPDGVIGVRGNHDHWITDDLRDQLKNTQIKVIENTNIVIRRGDDQLAFAGIGDLDYGVVDIESALAGLDDETPRILLSHNPDFAEECPPGHRVDLQISGHTHGGQVAPFGIMIETNSKYGSKLARGLCEGKAHRVYTSRGVGVTGPRVRIGSPPEVTVLVLQKA